MMVATVTHSMAKPGEENPNWNGGKTVTSHGYVLVKRPDHPEADVRGYVYEHRLVAEENLGRALKDNEIVHHKDGDKQNNDWENLEVVDGNAEHYKEHGWYNPETQDPDEENEVIECACGCGQTLKKYDSWGRPREYISGHNAKGGPVQDAVLSYIEENKECNRNEIAKALGKDPENVTSALGRLKDKGEIEDGGYGVWRAKE